MPGLKPTYSQKMRGIRDRQEYDEAAGEAAALTATSPMLRGDTMNYGQAIRDRGIASARAQTVQHYGIRRDMAQDADRAAAYQDQRVRDWAQMALSQKRVALSERAQDFEENRATTQDAERKREWGSGYNMNRWEGAERQRVGEREFGIRERDKERERDLGLSEKYTPESMAEYRKSGDAGALKRRTDIPEYAEKDIALTEKYTPESVKKYRESGDMKALQRRTDTLEEAKRQGVLAEAEADMAYVDSLNKGNKRGIQDRGNAGQSEYETEPTNKKGGAVRRLFSELRGQRDDYALSQEEGVNGGSIQGSAPVKPAIPTRDAAPGAASEYLLPDKQPARTAIPQRTPPLQAGEDRRPMSSTRESRAATRGQDRAYAASEGYDTRRRIKQKSGEFQASQKQRDKVMKQYPDARKAPDGSYYVFDKKIGKWRPVQ